MLAALIHPGDLDPSEFVGMLIFSAIFILAIIAFIIWVIIRLVKK